MAGNFSDGEDAPHYLDRRRRLRERFLAGGADAFPGYELMELVLFAAIPRRDVKPLAKELMSRFGSFADAIAAPRERLEEIKGVGEAVIAQFKIVEGRRCVFSGRACLIARRSARLSARDRQARARARRLGAYPRA